MWCALRSLEFCARGFARAHSFDRKTATKVAATPQLPGWLACRRRAFSRVNLIIQRQGLRSFITEGFQFHEKLAASLHLAEKSAKRGAGLFTDFLDAPIAQGRAASTGQNAAHSNTHSPHQMKKFLCSWTLYSLLALPVVLPLAGAQAEDLEDVVIEDYDAPETDISYITLAWSPNPEQNIVGYIVYYGRASNNYSRLVTVTETLARIGLKGSKTYYFAVTAFDTNGLESDLSEEVHWP